MSSLYTPNSPINTYISPNSGIVYALAICMIDLLTVSGPYILIAILIASVLIQLVLRHVK